MSNGYGDEGPEGWGPYDMSPYPKFGDGDGIAGDNRRQQQQQQEMAAHYYAAAQQQQQQQVHMGSYHQMQGGVGASYGMPPLYQQHAQPNLLHNSYNAAVAAAAYQSVNADMVNANHGLMNGMTMMGGVGMNMGMNMGNRNPYVQQHMDVINQQQMAAAAAYSYALGHGGAVAAIPNQGSSGNSGIAIVHGSTLGNMSAIEVSSSYPVVAASSGGSGSVAKPPTSDVAPAPNSSTKVLLSLLKVGGSSTSASGLATPQTKARSNSLGPPPGLSPGPPPRLQDMPSTGSIVALPPSQSYGGSGYTYNNNVGSTNNHVNTFSNNSTFSYSSILSNGIDDIAHSVSAGGLGVHRRGIAPGSSFHYGSLPLTLAPSQSAVNPPSSSLPYIQMPGAYDAAQMYAATQYSLSGQGMAVGGISNLTTLSYAGLENSMGSSVPPGAGARKDAQMRVAGGGIGSNPANSSGVGVPSVDSRSRPSSDHRENHPPRAPTHSSKPSDFSVTTDFSDSYSSNNLTIISCSRKKILRHVRDQEAELQIVIVSDSSGKDRITAIPLEKGGLSIRPLTNTQVIWTLPLEAYQAYGGRDLHIGLMRYGSISNSPCIISKAISGSEDLARGIDALGNSIMKGALTFSAPKSAGYFNCRLFDNTTKESASSTIGTSIAYAVDLIDNDVTFNLRFCLESIRNNNFQRGLSQIALTVRAMRDLGRPVYGDFGSSALLRQSLDLILSKLSNTRERDRDNNYAGSYSDRDDYYSGMDDKDDPVLRALFMSFQNKFMCKYFSDLLDLFTYLSRSRLALSLLLPEQVDIVGRYSSCYCSLLREFFAEEAERDAARVKFLGYSACRLERPVASPARTRAMERVDRHLDEYLSDAFCRSSEGGLDDDFVSARMGGIERIESILFAYATHYNVNNYNKKIRDSAANVKRFELLLLGSVASGFGDRNSNVNVCLSRQTMADVITAENRNDFLLEFGDFLAMQDNNKKRQASSAGGNLASGNFYRDIVVSPNNAAPFISFHDTAAKLTYCLHFYNPVYFHHSRLLTAYNMCDPRVRRLYVLVRCWAEARGLIASSGSQEGQEAKNGGDSNASNKNNNNKTYSNNTATNRDQEELNGFSLLLLVVHFLQHRPRPLLPILQTTPSEWDGLQDADRNSAAAAASDKLDTPLGKGGVRSGRRKGKKEESKEEEEAKRRVSEEGEERGEVVDERLDDNSSRIMSEQWYLLRPADKALCEAYFYDPNPAPNPLYGEPAATAESARRQQLLRTYAGGNGESLAELLEAFFRYFSYDFNYFKHVVSVKHRTVHKSCKAELSGWSLNERLCVEDPIDVDTDAVAHMRYRKMFLLRSELLRALTLFSRTYEPDSLVELLCEPEKLMELLCEKRL